MSLGKILVVDDDKNICELLRLYLEKEGYNVILSHDGSEAVVKFNALNPDLILLDIMLPGLDGWQVCREIRKKSNVPIIMLTAKGETFDKVLGLELGADDYVVKPFDTKEIIARVKAVLRRIDQNNAPAENKEVVYDKLVVNMTRYELKVDGKVIDTPPKELELLYHLRTVFIRAISCLTRFGASNITVIPEPLTFMSNGFGKNWKGYPISGP